MSNRSNSLIRTMLTAIAVLIATGAVKVSAETLRVPSEYPTIQAGIDAARDGDVVLVADGVYTGDGNRNLDFGGKDITLRSENGPENCVIRGEYDGADGIRFNSGETADSIVEGFRISRFHHAIRNDDSSPTVRNCILSGNLGIEGGGMFNINSHPNVTNCIFQNNHVGLIGGGMSNRNSSPTVTHCMFIDNRGADVGGAMGVSPDSDPTVTDCTFIGNSSDLGGSAMYIWGGCNPTFVNCSFIGHEEGAIMVFDSSPTFERCEFRDGEGTVISCEAECNLTLSNCRISDNLGRGVLCRDSSNMLITDSVIARNQRGIFCDEGSNILIRNSTVTENSFGGIFCRDSFLIVNNSIFWNNTPDEIFIEGEMPIVRYSNIMGGWPGGGNIDSDPLFADPDNGDFRLTAESPSIDAGDPNFEPDLGQTDLDGHGRVLCGRVDMGAYEFGIGDFDCNRLVDLLDFEQWLTCFTGPDGGPIAPGCEAFDTNADDDADWSDFATIQPAFTGD